MTIENFVIDMIILLIIIIIITITIIIIMMMMMMMIMTMIVIVIYIITQVTLAFCLVLAYDLLEDRCTIDVIITKFFRLPF